MKLTGYEVIQFEGGVCGYGFGLLEQRGYIDYVPEVYEWWTFSSERKRQWVVDINNEITRRLNEGHS